MTKQATIFSGVITIDKLTEKDAAPIKIQCECSPEGLQRLCEKLTETITETYSVLGGLEFVGHGPCATLKSYDTSLIRITFAQS